MARYIIMLNWTDQGIKNVKDTIGRAKAAGQAWEKAGGKLLDCVWTLGQYDLVLSVEAPDDEAVVATNIKLAGLGNVRTTTLRAFSENDMQRIMQKV